MLGTLFLIPKFASTNAGGGRYSMMLLPSFNSIGDKEIMKLLLNFHLTGCWKKPFSRARWFWWYIFVSPEL